MVIEMEMNKKLIIHSIILQAIGMIMCALITILVYHKIIDIKNTSLELIIFFASAIFCYSYYAFISNKYIVRNCTKECVILGIITIATLPVYDIAMSFNGLQQSIIQIWSGAAMSLTLHCIASHLEYIEEDVFVTERKYARLIKPLQYWGNLMLGCSFAVGFGGCFITRG